MKIEFIGTWRITEMCEWDQEYIDMVAPGHLTVKKDGAHHQRFHNVEPI